MAKVRKGGKLPVTVQRVNAYIRGERKPMSEHAYQQHKLDVYRANVAKEQAEKAEREALLIQQQAERDRLRALQPPKRGYQIPDVNRLMNCEPSDYLLSD